MGPVFGSELHSTLSYPGRVQKHQTYDVCRCGRQLLSLLYSPTSSPAAVAENEPIVRRCLEWPCSMLTMAVPDVEILAVLAFYSQYAFNGTNVCGLRGRKFGGIPI